jgi:hypothetical protein
MPLAGPGSQVLETLALSNKLKVVKTIGRFAFHTPRNLTGSYTLRLEEHVDRCVAGR